jgi:hypothetical protein
MVSVCCSVADWLRWVACCGVWCGGWCGAARRDAATGEVRIGIFTRRAVGVNEELTYDYMFEHYGLSSVAQGFKCQCGAKNCRCRELQCGGGG